MRSLLPVEVSYPPSILAVTSVRAVVCVRVMQAYPFALDLTPGQQRALLAHAGAARKAHNWALARVKAILDQRAAERSYGIPDGLLTPAQGWSLPALRKV